MTQLRRVEFDGQEYLRVAAQWLNATTYLKPPKVITNQLNARFSHLVADKKKRRRRSSSSSQNRHTKGIQKFLAPIIVKIVGRRYEKKQDYVTREEIMQALMSHPKASERLEKAYESKDRARDFEWYVGNRVDLLSANITADNTDHADRLERERVDGKWAYKPAAA